MNRKLPSDAFDAYVALGEQRTYAALAEHFQVDRKTVIRRAKKEDWKGRLASIQQAARRTSDQKLAESIEQMNDRHLATLRVIQGKALQALRAMPISAAMDAVRALDVSIRGERLIRGEPTDRNAVNIEDVIRREYERWMVRGDDDEPEAAPAPAQVSSVPSSAPPEIGDAALKPTPGMEEAGRTEEVDDDDDDDAE